MKKVLITSEVKNIHGFNPAPGKHPSTRIMKENIWEIRLYIPDAELTRFISEIQNMMDFRCWRT